jgi:predicted TIM-barrel fold metal-dependent hydrolase
MQTARRIDVHPHIIPQFYQDAVRAAGLGPARRAGALRTVADPARIVFGSDWPFVPPPLVAAAVNEHMAPELHSDAERAAIDRGNALKLFAGRS